MDYIFFVATIFSIFYASVCPTKPYNSGQRIFTDIQSIEFIDPSKHGFHIVLHEEFVTSHLQPVHAPTVYASAIALQQSHGHSHTTSNRSNRSISTNNGLLRLTKTLYPESGNAEDGLLDGRTIKLLGLREKTWYYVCVEFESNLRRHELVTGMTCQLKRTLDKFGQSVDSTITEIELIDITDRSIAIGLTVTTDFPLFLHAYLDPDGTSVSSSPPAQSYFIRPMPQDQHVRVIFGPYLQADTPYGKLCVVEDPWLETYTAMGRAVRTARENCYFSDLKTKPSPKMGQQDGKKAQRDSPYSTQHIRPYQVGLRGTPSSAARAKFVGAIFIAVVLFDVSFAV